jgi:hypothetical protein
MHDYDVVDHDGNKVGHAVERQDGFLIVETGLLKKTRHAVPVDTARTDEDEHVVRLTISKEMLEEGPVVEDDGTDWQAIRDYYGRTPELEGQTAGIEPDDQRRARLRESLSAGAGVETGPPKGSVGIHQDRWETKE